MAYNRTRIIMWFNIFHNVVFSQLRINGLHYQTVQQRGGKAGMKIGGTGIADIQQYNGTPGQAIAADAETQNFQTQIASAQTQLQKLSADNNISPEEKAEKRKEIQKQIAELNKMLREHKMELRREKQQQAAEETASSAIRQKEGQGQAFEEKAVENKPEVIVEHSGISPRHIKAIVAANSSVGRVKTQDNVSKKLENRVRTLEGEIKQAAETGGYIEAKKGELESLENKVEKISGAKANILTSAINEIKQAVDEEEKKDIKSAQGKNTPVKEPADLPSKDFVAKKQVDKYANGKMFSSVDIHF